MRSPGLEKNAGKCGKKCGKCEKCEPHPPPPCMKPIVSTALPTCEAVHFGRPLPYSTSSFHTGVFQILSDSCRPPQ